MSDGHYTITLNQEQRLVYVIAQGEFDLDLGEQLITDARQKATENQYNILCDVRASRANVNLADWFFLPRRLTAYKNLKTRNITTAIVVTTGRQENVYRFFETVAGNIGLRIKIFLDEEDALEWLEVGSK